MPIIPQLLNPQWLVPLKLITDSPRKGNGRGWCQRIREFTQTVDSNTLMAARSQPNDDWGSVGNGAKHGEKHVGGGSGM